jgi:hypothetical protein
MKKDLITLLLSFLLTNGFCQYDFDNTGDTDYEEEFEITNEEDDNDNYKSSKDLKGYAFELLGTSSFNSHPDGTFPFVGLGAYLRYNYYTPTDYLSLSVGSPLNIGVQISSQTTTQSDVLYFHNIPLEFCLNVGARATKEADYILGVFFGAGISYNYSHKKSSDIIILNSHSAGPHVSFGFRYKYSGRPLGVRISLMSGVLNNFKKDPSIIYEGETNPLILNLSIAYGLN